ncbi:MAG: amidinotransferase [Candidatus Eremiobacteraeota bacterium]|jgi:glycine amidinotransferase|nr:amidinotransferase [Candidatus Eremiobacteraeota bacterium]
MTFVLSEESSSPVFSGSCPVESHNEWDPLEEIIVGRLEGAVIPSNHIAINISVPRRVVPLFALFSGMRYPGFLVKPAEKELERLVSALESFGVVVRRPEPLDGRRWLQTPEWKSRGFCTACPRDGFLVVGQQILETPMPWRCRFHEGVAYRELFQEYHRRGARWTAAPRPRLSDELYDYSYRVPGEGEAMRYVLTEVEPVFDAADFARCGRDLFVTRSNVTNLAGIDWLRQHLGPEYRIHLIESKCRQPMHIDSTFIPLAPGKVMVNPDFIDVDRLPPILKKWDVLVAPRPDKAPGPLVSLCSPWLSMNVLMLDERRVICDYHQKSMISALKGWGFEPVPLPFTHFAPFGGSFHCATLDIRRRGSLQDYFV